MKSPFNLFKKSQEKDTEDLTKARDKKCNPLAIEMLRMIAASDGVIGQVTQKEMVESYDPLIKDILMFLKNNDVKLTEVNYLFRLIAQRTEHVKEWLNLSINKNMAKVYEDYWGKAEAEVTLDDLDKTLIQNAAEIKPYI